MLSCVVLVADVREIDIYVMRIDTLRRHSRSKLRSVIGTLVYTVCLLEVSKIWVCLMKKSKRGRVAAYTNFQT